MALGSRPNKVMLDEGTKDKIRKALIAEGVRLPDGAMLYELDGKPYVYILNQDLALRLYAKQAGGKGNLQGARVNTERPPLSLVQPWGLPNEPATQLIEAIKAVEGVTDVEMEYGANTDVVCLNIFCRRGKKSDKLQDAVNEAVRKVQERNSRLVVFPGHVMEK